VWAVDGGPEKILERLSSDTDRSRIIDHISGLPNVWTEYALVGAESSLNSPYEGLDFVSVAGHRRMEVPEWICCVLEEENLRACYIHHGAHEGNVREILKWDGQMIGSDGLHLPAKTHPRLYGTFPRVLGKYVREERVISLESAVYKMTGAPAARLGLNRRGLLKPGYAADLVLFDPLTVADTATFENPLRYPAGIPHVFVNGVAVKFAGEPTNTLAGMVLRRN
jgi:N-acyl-D-amino-acid deacylase